VHKRQTATCGHVFLTPTCHRRTVTDHISMGGNAITSVHLSGLLSVFRQSFEPTDLWPWSFACVWVITMAHR